MTTPPTQHPNEPDQTVDRYLDNLMSTDERAAFELRLAAEPELAAEVQRQQEVDAALRDYATPPSPNAILAAIADRAAALERAPASDDDAPPSLRIRPLSPWRRYAVAAVLLLGVFGAWQLVRLITAKPNGTYIPGPHQSLVQAYEHTVDTGFHTDWTCRDDAEFAMTIFDQLGQMLSMNPPLPENTLALGLEYYNVLSPKTIGMLTRVDGEPAMIFIDRLENDDKNAVSAVEDGKHIFRRELGDLVLYEVTPLDHPGLINHLRQPSEIPVGEGPHGSGR